MTIREQLFELFILAIPISSIAWTITHEEIFREPREWCLRKSETVPTLLGRKFFTFLRVDIVLAIT